MNSDTHVNRSGNLNKTGVKSVWYKLVEEIEELENQIFSVQMCDDPIALAGVETLIQKITLKRALLKSLLYSEGSS